MALLMEYVCCMILISGLVSISISHSSYGLICVFIPLRNLLPGVTSFLYLTFSGAGVCFLLDRLISVVDISLLSLLSPHLLFPCVILALFLSSLLWIGVREF